MTKEIKKPSISQLPSSINYYSISFLEPQDVVNLFFVSKFWRLEIDQFLIHSMGKSWQRQYENYKNREIKLISGNFNNIMISANKDMSNLVGWVLGYGKYTIISCLICIKIVRENPNLIAGVDAFEILKKVYQGVAVLSGSFFVSKFALVSGTLAHRSIQKYRKNKNLEANQKALASLQR